MGWDWDIGQWFRPPKSKSIWEAMTAGSTGGWAKPLQAWGPAFTAAAGAIPGVGPFLSTGMGLAGMAGGKTGFRGTDYGWSNLAPMAMGGLQGFGLGGLGKGVASGVGAMMRSGTSPVLNRFVTGFGQGLKDYWGTTKAGVGKVMSLFGGQGAASTPYALTTQPTMASQLGYGTQATAAIPSTLAATSYGAGAIPGISAVAGKSYLDTLFSSAKEGLLNPMTLAGAGVALAGGAAGPKITVPESPYMGEYTARLLSGTPLSQFGKAGLEKLGTEWTKPEFTPLSDDMYEAAVRKNKEEEEKAIQQLRTEWKGVRPGADIESDAGFRKSIMDTRQRFSNERMALNTELAYNRENEYLGRLDNYFQNKMNYFVNTMNLSQAEINQFGQLAQLDTERLIAQTGLNAGEAAAFKQLFGDIGKLMMMQGMGLDFKSLVSIFNPTGRV